MNRQSIIEPLPIHLLRWWIREAQRINHQRVIECLVSLGYTVEKFEPRKPGPLGGWPECHTLTIRLPAACATVRVYNEQVGLYWTRIKPNVISPVSISLHMESPSGPELSRIVAKGHRAFRTLTGISLDVRPSHLREPGQQTLFPVIKEA